MPHVGQVEAVVANVFHPSELRLEGGREGVRAGAGVGVRPRGGERQTGADASEAIDCSVPSTKSRPKSFPGLMHLSITDGRRMDGTAWAFLIPSGLF
jgi:hypothetical protein